MKIENLTIHGGEQQLADNIIMSAMLNPEPSEQQFAHKIIKKSTISNLETNENHIWRFSRLGGFDQVQLNTGEDLRALPELDQKLWAVLSCPAHGLEIDQRTLTLLDSDHDDRIRVPEIIAAVEWTTSLLNDPAELIHGNSSLPLSAINPENAEGQRLLQSMREILKALGKSQEDTITLADLAQITQIFITTCFNGDGVIPPQASADKDVQTLIQEIMQCCGAERDRCGDFGITQEKIELFFQEAKAFVAWWQTGLVQNISVLSFTQATETVAQAFLNLETKIDDFFMRCQLAAYDANSTRALNPSLESYTPFIGKNLSPNQVELENLPLAQIQAGRDLPLLAGINPVWQEAVKQFRQAIVLPLFGESDSLSEAQWQTIKQQLQAYFVWQQQKQGTRVESLGVTRLTQILTGNYYATLSELIRYDQSFAPEALIIETVEKLLYYRRDLYKLLNNFVNFHAFYADNPQGIFQVGQLYLDGRCCELCIQVDEIAQHATMAALGGIFLVYCECRRVDNSEILKIAAAFTDGDADNLLVGRNGIFYDRHGQDWDATIVKIIEHPISVYQAFWAPYKRFARMVNEQIEKFSAAKPKNVSHHGATDETTEPAVIPANFDVGKFAGIFAAIGLAIGAIGTVIASIVSGFLALPSWKMPLAILGLMLLISAPSVLIAYLKLRRRNLAFVLDASGWAVNAKAYINIPFGRSLTSVAKLPKNAVRQMFDPFEEKQRPWRIYLLIVLFIVLLIGLARFFILR